jgi:hypothetical protein
MKLFFLKYNFSQKTEQINDTILMKLFFLKYNFGKKNRT